MNEQKRDVMTLDGRTGQQIERQGAMTPMDMIQVAVQGGQSLDVIEKLMNLQERWEANQGRKAFDNAIAAAKAEIPPIFKNRTVDFTSQKGRTHYKHEDLAEIARTVDPILGQHGLSYRYRTKQDGNRVTVTCIVSHKDGYSEETSLSAANDESGNKNSIQSIGSAITFLQRYTLKAALGLAATVDDDGRKSEPQEKEPELISKDELATLRDELDARGGDVRALCEFLKLEALADLRKVEFPRILSLIKKKPLVEGEPS
jgi:hypothetical protein